MGALERGLEDSCVRSRGEDGGMFPGRGKNMSEGMARDPAQDGANIQESTSNACLRWFLYIRNKRMGSLEIRTTETHDSRRKRVTEEGSVLPVGREILLPPSRGAPYHMLGWA